MNKKLSLMLLLAIVLCSCSNHKFEPFKTESLELNQISEDINSKLSNYLTRIQLEDSYNDKKIDADFSKLVESDYNKGALNVCTQYESLLPVDSVKNLLEKTLNIRSSSTWNKGIHYDSNKEILSNTYMNGVDYNNNSYCSVTINEYLKSKKLNIYININYREESKINNEYHDEPSDSARIVD